MSLYTIATIVVVALLALLIIVRLVNNAVVQSLRLMEEADPFLDVADNGHAKLSSDPSYAWRHEWAVANGFEPDLLAASSATLDGSTILIAVWKNHYKSTSFASYAAGNSITCEFVTTLSDDGGLTTSNNKDSSLLPQRPGHITQVFDGVDLSTLYEKHETGLIHLHERKHLSIVDPHRPTAELIAESVKKQTAYIKTLPFWKYRGAWWYFVRRPRMNNRSVADQIGR